MGVLRNLEEACTHAALRLVNTAINVVKTNGISPAQVSFYYALSKFSFIDFSNFCEIFNQVSDIPPLVALGNDAVLQGLIEKTQRGVASLEDISALQVEKTKLEECIEELQVSLTSLDKKRFEKNDLVKAVNTECDTAKEKARSALHELQRLADQMVSQKEEIESLESAKSGIEREIEGKTRKLNDLAAVIEIETKNLNSIRKRLSSARDETSRWELLASETRLEADTEEKKLRDTKMIASDQIKLLQQDVARLHSDIKANRRAIEDSEKIKANLDDEILKRRSDADTQFTLSSRDLDETLRKTSALRSEQRNIQIDIDKLIMRKRQVCLFPCMIFVLFALALFS